MTYVLFFAECAGNPLDKPLAFLHYCLTVEDDIEEEDFVREIMGFLPPDQRQERWYERVASLYGGKTTWHQFSQSLADSLGLQGGRRDDGTDSGRLIIL
jgi:hypothetical protein